MFNAPAAKAKVLLAAHIDFAAEEHLDPAEPDIAKVVRIFARMERAIPEYWPLIKDRRRVLDVCAGTGEFAFLMNRLGFSVEALEPTPVYAAYARHVLGVEVEPSFFIDKTYEDGAFDLIRVRRLLTSTPDPFAALAVLRRWLSDDGLLYVELPNIEAEAAVRPQGELFEQGQVVSFNPVSLRVAMAQAGFKEAAPDRHRGTTAGFFRKAPPVPAKANARNARRVSDAITRHFAARPLGERLGRLVGGLKAKVEDRREGRGWSDHRAAAEHFAAQLRQRLEPAANVQPEHA